MIDSGETSPCRDVLDRHHETLPSRTLQSTRALFVSVVGFRPKVVTALQSGVKSVLLMSGRVLADQTATAGESGVPTVSTSVILPDGV